jgi:hypothetical protein
MGVSSGTPYPPTNTSVATICDRAGASFEWLKEHVPDGEFRYPELGDKYLPLAAIKAFISSSAGRISKPPDKRL